MIEQSPLDGPELYLCSGLPGFPGAHRFRLMPCGGTTGPFFRLLCLDRDLVFVVATPEVFSPTTPPKSTGQPPTGLGSRLNPTPPST